MNSQFRIVSGTRLCAAARWLCRATLRWNGELDEQGDGQESDFWEKPTQRLVWMVTMFFVGRKRRFVHSKSRLNKMIIAWAGGKDSWKNAAGRSLWSLTYLRSETSGVSVDVDRQRKRVQMHCGTWKTFFRGSWSFEQTVSFALSYGLARCCRIFLNALSTSSSSSSSSSHFRVKRFCLLFCCDPRHIYVDPFSVRLCCIAHVFVWCELRVDCFPLSVRTLRLVP